LRTRNLGVALLVVAASLVGAGAAFAGIPDAQRLNGGFFFEDDREADENEACLIASGTVLFTQGRVLATSGDCTVVIAWVADFPNKASGSVLKDDGSGTAKVSQQVETFVNVGVTGGLCPTPFNGFAFPEKCKASGSVKAVEPSGTVDSAKAKVSCDLGEDLTELDSPSQAVVDTVVDAFADRSDVKLGENGKLTINVKGVPNSGGHFCAI
jgi:hypothetical protein